METLEDLLKAFPAQKDDPFADAVGLPELEAEPAKLDTLEGLLRAYPGRKPPIEIKPPPRPTERLEQDDPGILTRISRFLKDPKKSAADAQISMVDSAIHGITPFQAKRVRHAIEKGEKIDPARAVLKNNLVKAFNNNLDTAYANLNLGLWGWDVLAEGDSQKAWDAIRMTKEQMEAMREQAPYSESELQSLVGDIASVAPFMYESAKAGAWKGMLLSGGTMLMGAVTGSSAITYPLAAKMYGIGQTAGSFEFAGKITAGNHFLEMLDYEDPKTKEKINPSIARAAALGVGAISGMLESVGVSAIVKSFPGGRKFFSNVLNETIEEVVKSGALKDLAIRAAGQYGKTLTTETGVEIAQEGVKIAGDVFARKLTNAVEEKNIEMPGLEDSISKLLETAVQAARGFSLIAGAGPGIGLAKGIKLSKKEADLQARKQKVVTAKTVQERKKAEGVEPEIEIDEEMIQEYIDDPEKSPLTDEYLDKLFEEDLTEDQIADNIMEELGLDEEPFVPAEIAPAPEKDLVALHNTTENELLRAIESGGLAMPSVAVTKKDIPFEKYGGITLVGRRDLVDTLEAFVEFSKNLKNAPTQYFEAKAQRAVRFDEFAGAVIPTDASKELKAKLKEAGLPYKTYKKRDTEGRQKAIGRFHKEAGVLFDVAREERELKPFKIEDIKDVGLKEAVETGLVTDVEAAVYDGIIQVMPENWKKRFDIRFSEQEFAPTKAQLKAHGVKPGEPMAVRGALLPERKVQELKGETRRVAVMFKGASIDTFLHEFGEFTNDELLTDADRELVNSEHKKAKSGKAVNEWFSDEFRDWWLRQLEGKGDIVSPELQGLFQKLKDVITQIWRRLKGLGETGQLDNLFQEMMTEGREVRDGRPAVPADIDTRKDTGVTYLADDTPIEFKYEVLELEDVIASHTADGRPDPRFDKALQPRAREKKAYQLQTAEMAAKLNPEARLGASQSIASGAPMISPDTNMVEAGHGRTQAIAKAYKSEGLEQKGEEYKEWINKNAARFGVGDISNLKQPVLVRRRITPVKDIKEITEKSNIAEIAKMSATEQGIIDAGNITKDDLLLFKPDADGNINAASNKIFINRFLLKMDTAERAGYTTADGKANKQLIDRIQAAIFQKAYQADDLLALTAEEADPDLSNVLNGLNAAAGNFAQARGIKEDLDGSSIVDDIVAAINFIRRAKADYPELKTSRDRTRLTNQVRQAIGQQDLFGREETSDSLEIALVIADNIQSGKRIGEFLDQIAVKLKEDLADLDQMDLFAAKEEITNERLIGFAKRALGIEVDKEIEELAEAKEQDQIKEELKAVVKSTKEAYEQGKQEGFEQGKAHIKAIVARAKERQELRAETLKLRKRWDKATKLKKGQLSTTTRWDKKELPDKLATQLKEARDAAKLTKPGVEAKKEELYNEINSHVLYNAMEDRPDVVDYDNDLMRQFALLDRFGAMKQMNRDELLDAVHWAEEFLESALIEQEARVAKKKKKDKNRRDAWDAAVMAGAGKVKKKRPLFTSPMMFRDLMYDMVRHAKGQVKEKAEQLIQDLTLDISRANQSTRIEQTNENRKLRTAVKDIYGLKNIKQAEDKLRELSLLRPEYEKHSKHFNQLSKSNLLQIVAWAEQEGYADAVEESGRDIEAVKAELDGADLAFLDWMRDYYNDTREALSEVSERVTGMEIKSPDDLYMPVKLLNDGGIGETHITPQIIPKSLSTRVHNKRDINEEWGVLDVFSERVHSNAVFKNFSELAIDLRGVFAAGETQRTIKDALGEEYFRRFEEHLVDIMTQKPLGQFRDSISRLLMNFGVAKLWLSGGPALRQLSSIPAFAFDHGLANTGRYVAQAFTREGLQYANEVFRSEQAAARFEQGQSHMLAEIFSWDAPKTKIVASLKRFARETGLAPNKWMDALTIATVGGGIYRSYINQAVEGGKGEAEARKWAMDMLWMEAEHSQQSAFVSQQSRWQRRGGEVARVAGMFTSTPQQFLSRELRDIKKALATNRKADWKALGNTLAVNHIIMPTLFNTLNIIWRGALGAEPDENDIDRWVAFMITGPFGGWFLGGSMISAAIETLVTGRKPWHGSAFIPASGFIGDVESATLVVTALFQCDWDKAKKEVNNIIKANAPLYRDLKKAFKNYVN